MDKELQPQQYPLLLEQHKHALSEPMLALIKQQQAVGHVFSQEGCALLVLLSTMLFKSEFNQTDFQTIASKVHRLLFKNRLMITHQTGNQQVLQIVYPQSVHNQLLTLWSVTLLDLQTPIFLQHQEQLSILEVLHTTLHGELLLLELWCSDLFQWTQLIHFSRLFMGQWPTQLLQLSQLISVKLIHKLVVSITTTPLPHALQTQLLVWQLEQTLQMSPQPLSQHGQLFHTEQPSVLLKMEESFTLPTIQIWSPTHLAQLTFAMVSQLMEFTPMSQHFSTHISWDASEQDQMSLECTNNAQPTQEHAESLTLPPQLKKPFHLSEKWALLLQLFQLQL